MTLAASGEYRRRGHGAVELVRLLQPGGQGLVKVRPEADAHWLPTAGVAWSVRRSRTVADWPGPTVSR